MRPTVPSGAKDCAGVVDGTAQVDACGKCQGTNACADCAGVANGPHKVDKCGRCDADVSNGCREDCKGAWGGPAKEDRCGVCGGRDTCLDCKGVPNGANRADMCGGCDTNTTNDCRASLPSPLPVRSQALGVGQ